MIGEPYVPDALSLVGWSWKAVLVKVPAPVTAVRKLWPVDLYL